MRIDVKLNLVHKTLDDRQCPHSITVTKFMLECLCPVERTTDHRVVQFLDMMQWLCEIVCVGEVHALFKNDY